MILKMHAIVTTPWSKLSPEVSNKGGERDDEQRSATLTHKGLPGDARLHGASTLRLH